MYAASGTQKHWWSNPVQPSFNCQVVCSNTLWYNAPRSHAGNHWVECAGEAHAPNKLFPLAPNRWHFCLQTLCWWLIIISQQLWSLDWTGLRRSLRLCQFGFQSCWDCGAQLGDLICICDSKGEDTLHSLFIQLFFIYLLFSHKTNRKECNWETFQIIGVRK